MRFARFLAFAVLVVAAFMAAVPAYAQGNKPVRSGNWYEDRATGSSSSGSLILSFAQAPTDKFLNVTHVACGITMSNNLVLATLLLSGATASGGSGDLGRSQTIRGNAIAETTSASARYYSVINKPYLKFGPGRFPYIYLGSQTISGSISVECVIVGDLSDN